MGRQKYHYNEDFFFNESPELAYFMGWFSSDGNMVYSKKEYTIRFNISYKDVEILELFRKWICPEKPIYIMNRKHESGNISKMCQLSIHGKDICEYLVDKYKIIVKKTGNEVVMFYSNPKLFGHWLHGVFDGDGSASLHKDNRVHAYICSASYSFLSEIQEICKFGVIYSYKIPYWIITNCNDIIKFKDIIYQDNFKGLSRKCKIFESGNFNRSRSYLSDDDLEYIKNNCNLLSNEEIGLKLGRKPEQIQIIAVRNKWKPSQRPRWDSEAIEMLTNYLENDFSYIDISKLMSRSISSLQTMASRLKLTKQYNVIRTGAI